MGPKAWGMLAALLLATTGQAADPFNVDFSVGWENFYRPGEWTPVEIGIVYKRKEPLGGLLWVSAKQDDLTLLNVRHPVVITPEVPLYLPLVTKLVPGGGTCEVSITDQRGRKQWSREYPLLAYSSDSPGATPLEGRDLLIGLVGRRSAGIAQLGKHAVSQTEEGAGLVRVKDKLPHLLPWDWTGYASLDLLLLYNPDWDLINAHQARAIRQWVSNGGKVLFVLGGRPLPAGGGLAEMLPLKIGPLRKLPLREGGAPFALPSSRRGDEVNAWTLEELRDPGWTLERAGREAILAHGQVGFGRVGVLAFDPADLTGDSAEDTAALWAWCAKGLLDRRKLQTGTPPSESDRSPYGGYGRLYGGEQSASASDRALDAVLEHLLQIPELRPLSIWWVIALLSLLALLLGPADYLLLKRLDRLPLTWVTSAGIILLFTAGAYYGVQALRAGATQVRAVTVTDAVQGESAWSTSYVGIFASSSDDYRLEDLQAGQWWSGLSPASESSPFRSRGEEISTRRIYCHQQDGGNLPYSLPISIWSMQCLLAERLVLLPPLSAEVRLSGQKVTVDLTNRSAGRVRQVWIRQWDKGASLGPVPAKGSARLQGEMGATAFSGPEGPAGIACGAPGTLQRTPAIDAYLQRGAAVIYAFYDESPTCCRVAGATHSATHTELVRLVVFPRKDGGP